MCIVRENVCNKAKKRKKSRFWILKKKNRKIRSLVHWSCGRIATQPGKICTNVQIFSAWVGSGKGFSVMGLVQKCLVGFLQKLIQGNPVQPMDDTQPTTYCALNLLVTRADDEATTARI